jgi:hypothetical protein
LGDSSRSQNGPVQARNREAAKSKIYLATTIAVLGLAAAAVRNSPPPQFPNMTFFITSTSGPNGANFGGLDGADKHCQTLAEKAGAGGKTWRAYLSTQAVGGATAVNAKDRIGKGPWVNAKGVQIAANVEDLHGPNNKIRRRTWSPRTAG